MKYFFFIIAFFSSAYSQQFSDTTLHKIIAQGVEYTVQQQYDSAKFIFRTIIKKYPTHPLGYLYLTGTLQAEFSDYENFVDENLQDSLLTIGIDLAEKFIEKNPNDAWGYYYKGTGLAFRAFLKTQRSGWFGAIFDGTSSASSFEQCLQLNPKFYNAMSGLGTYYYWKSRVPFFTNQEEEGITLLKNAVSNASFDSHIAHNSLIEILIDAQRYDEALHYVQSGLTKYPNNRSLLWQAVTIYEKKQNKNELKKMVPRLLSSIINAPTINYYREILCRLKLSRYAMNAKEYDAVIKECMIMLSYKNNSQKIYKNIDKKLEEANILLQKAKIEIAKK